MKGHGSCTLLTTISDLYLIKKHTHKNKNKNKTKQIKKTKPMLQLFLMANFDRVNRSIDTRVWKGRRFENILKYWTVI
jgi:hypothetical protein